MSTFINVYGSYFSPILPRLHQPQNIRSKIYSCILKTFSASWTFRTLHFKDVKGKILATCFSWLRLLRVLYPCKCVSPNESKFVCEHSLSFRVHSMLRLTVLARLRSQPRLDLSRRYIYVYSAATWSPAFTEYSFPFVCAQPERSLLCLDTLQRW